MKVILVSGGNKGIGLAIVSRLLSEFPDTHILLGSRDKQRGEAAVKELVTQLGQNISSRIEMILLDVGNEESVSTAVETIKNKFGSLYGLVNNAGGWLSTEKDTIQLNAYSVVRMCEAFVPLIQDNGRIVQISSSAGPSYVSKCSQEIQSMLVSEGVTWSEVERVIVQPYLNIVEDTNLNEDGKKAALEGLGLVDGAYGVAKAAVNAYTVELARRYPGLRVNACTPGFIATDLTSGFAEKSGKTMAEMGAKTPFEGATAAVKLTMGSLGADESGRYYGSDAMRSPLHKYRSPGSPEYDGAFP